MRPRPGCATCRSRSSGRSSCCARREDESREAIMISRQIAESAQRPFAGFRILLSKDWDWRSRRRAYVGSMKFRLVLWSVALVFARFESNAATAARPNILLIMADDMGFSDIGCFGS